MLVRPCPPHGPPEHLPKDLLYGQLAQGKRWSGRPFLRYKEVCKGEMKAAKISVDNWAEVEGMRTLEEKRQRKKASTNNRSNAITYACSHCHRPSSPESVFAVTCTSESAYANDPLPARQKEAIYI